MSARTEDSIVIASLTEGPRQRELITSNLDVRRMLARVSFLVFEYDDRGVPDESRFMVCGGVVEDQPAELLLGEHRFSNGTVDVTTHSIEPEPIDYGTDEGEFVGIGTFDELIEYGDRMAVETTYNLVPLDGNMRPIEDESQVEIVIESPDRIRALESLIEADTLDTAN